MTENKPGSPIADLLSRQLAAGLDHIGEIVVSGAFELRHAAEAGRGDLRVFNKACEAREIAQFDAGGAFRPLKTAPTLRRGWVLRLRTIGEVREALEAFYPAMLGVLLAHERGVLHATNLRETLGRQSGMYAGAKNVSDAQADALAGECCRSDGKCLKTILWKIAPGVSFTSLPREKFNPAANQLGDSVPAIPLLCHEACNLYVAAARQAVKNESRK